MHASKLVRGSQVCLIAGLGGKTAFCGVVKKKRRAGAPCDHDRLGKLFRP
jgi:hypothetical protein